MSKVVVRFAPSPTGYLHLGGARTALYNWLFARKHKGEFKLRIEDTDLSRSSEESAKAIMDALEWLGLKWDGEVIYQSKRFHIYREYLQRLEEEGKAYRCYCSPEQLENEKKEALKQGKSWRYPGRCRERKDHPKGIPYVLRLRMPDEGETTVEDMILGPVSVPNSELGDWVLARADGTPLYNFVCVIDDVLMGITHVIRGVDHLDNTKRQVHLYKALGFAPPRFAHLPLIKGLSKRKGSESIQAYRDSGYLPEALINYIVRLGWGYGDKEIFSLEELIELFDITKVNKSLAQVNPDKLLWLNSHYIKESEPQRLLELLKPFLKEIEVDITRVEPEKLIFAIKTMQPRSHTLKELAEGIKFYFIPDESLEYDKESVSKYLKPENRIAIEKSLQFLEAQSEFRLPDLENNFKGFLEKEGIKLKDVAQPLRVATTGKGVGPGLFETFVVLGKEHVVNRIKLAIQKFM